MTDVTIIGPRPDARLALASENLTSFVWSQAIAMSKLTGVTWQPSDSAPADYHSLCREYAKALTFGEPLPVSDRFCESTIYVGTEANVAFRYWHDLTHVRLGRGFDVHGEVEVARAHLSILEAYGLGPATIEYQLLSLDTLGQTLCSAATGGFPADQRCFVRNGLRDGLPVAIRKVLGDQQ